MVHVPGEGDAVNFTSSGYFVEIELQYFVFPHDSFAEIMRVHDILASMPGAQSCWFIAP